MSKVPSEDVPVLKAGRYFLVSYFQMLYFTTWQYNNGGNGCTFSLCKLFLQKQLRVLQNSLTQS